MNKSQNVYRPISRDSTRNDIGPNQTNNFKRVNGIPWIVTASKKIDMDRKIEFNHKTENIHMIHTYSLPNALSSQKKRKIISEAEKLYNEKYTTKNIVSCAQNRILGPTWNRPSTGFKGKKFINSINMKVCQMKPKSKKMNHKDFILLGVSTKASNNNKTQRLKQNKITKRVHSHKDNNKPNLKQKRKSKSNYKNTKGIEELPNGSTVFLI